MLAPRLGTINTYYILDSSATRRAFIDISFTQFHRLSFITLNQPQSITVVDGRPTTTKVVTHLIRVPLIIDNYIENINIFATKLGYYLIILGIL